MVRTDHSSLTWLLNIKQPQGQIARWLEELSQYDMHVVHRVGKKHGNADGFSRIPDELDVFCSDFKLGFQILDLPCNGCNYCEAHRNNIVPLSVRPKQVKVQSLGLDFAQNVDNVPLSVRPKQMRAESLSSESSEGSSCECLITHFNIPNEEFSGDLHETLVNK